MTAPWRTCAHCGTDLYPRTARRTDEGWTHSACPIEAAPFMRCPKCHHAVDPTPTGLCRECDEFGLFEGEWVRDGLILRWQEAS